MPSASARPRVRPDGDVAEWQPRPGQHLSILFDVFELGQRVRTLLAVAMRDAGMRPDEYAAYSVVFEDGPVTMTELARTLGMPTTTAADYVRAMLARRHVTRTTHPTDNRAYLLALTAGGKRAHRRASARFECAYRSFVRELGPHREAAAREVLQQLAASAARAAESIEPIRRGG